MRSLLTLPAILAGALSAQQPAYVPANDLPNGREIVAVYIGGENCGPCHAPEVKAAVRNMKVLLATQAKHDSAAFSVIGVANDWDTKVAADFLADVQPFDQMVLGGNWTNLAIERFIWRDSTGQAAMPQVVVIERNVVRGNRITFSEPRVLRRVVGATDIPAWVDKG